jgi:glyoxylase-like metal-dependent hydrolase (beta-lactamase superfamily II)
MFVDTGLRARQILQRLGLLGLKMYNIDGILLTHELQDHIGVLERLSCARVLPIFCATLTQEYLLRYNRFSTPPA